jgi:hypothetical protein
MKNSTLPLWGTDEKFHVTFVGEQMHVPIEDAIGMFIERPVCLGD